jgi:hypothetical protein
MSKDTSEDKKMVEAFAKIGDWVEYLGVKMLVVGYHDFKIGFKVGNFCPIPYPIPVFCLNVEWMDSYKHLQKASIVADKIQFCRNITVGVSELFPKQ